MRIVGLLSSSVAVLLALTVFTGCDDSPKDANAQPVVWPHDPYAPKPAAWSPPADGANAKPADAGAATAALDARLTAVEGKLDEVLKLLYDATVASDKRYAEMKSQLDALSAQRAGIAPVEAGTAAVPPVVDTPEQAPAPAKVAAPEWTAEQKQWIGRYEANFTGDKPLAVTPQDTDLIGAKLPQTRFLAAAGGVLDVNDYTKKKQKVVLVMLRGFAGSICLYCSAQTLSLSREEAEFKKRDAQVVLIYPGKAETVPMFLDAISKLDPQHPLTFPVGMDVDLSAVHLFRIRGELAKPTTLIIDGEGVVRFAYVGANPTDRPSVKDMLAELDKLK